jgi:hypothetical protein
LYMDLCTISCPILHHNFHTRREGRLADKDDKTGSGDVHDQNPDKLL